MSYKYANAIGSKPQKAFISRDETVMLQGIAVLLMVWHHLFGFPDRIFSPYIMVFDSIGNVETLLSYFGRICIAVFAFCSGYGMQVKAVPLQQKGMRVLLNSYSQAINRLGKFYQKYWLVFFSFVPLGFFLKVYSFQLLPFLKGILGMNSVYNAEWWYIVYYIQLILLFPVLNYLGSLLEIKCPILQHVFLIAFLLILSLLPATFAKYNFLLILCYFVEGMYLARINLFMWVYESLQFEWSRLVAGIVLLIAVFVLRTIGLPDYVLVPVFVFAVVMLLKNRMLLRLTGSLLRLTGKYSTYIWLTHTFFAYYYFQNLTYTPKYSWLIAAFCIALCICCGMILELLAALPGKTCRFCRK